MKFILIFYILFFNPYLFAQCLKWSPSRQLSNLNTQLLPEISGISASKNHPRLYFLNDSEKTPQLFFTDLNGTSLKSFKINKINFRDTEALSYEKCLHNKNVNCIYIADIGDNLQRRDFISIYIIEEKEIFSSNETPVQTIKLKYPENTYDAESFAIHPQTLDFYLITKNIKPFDHAPPSKIYKFNASSIKKNKSDTIHTLEYLTDLPLSSFQPNNWMASIATDMSISHTGKSFLLLTYAGVFEFFIDLNLIKLLEPKNYKQGIDFQWIPISTLPQMEAITYSHNSKAFFYTTELSSYFPDQKEVPLMKSTCLE